MLTGGCLCGSVRYEADGEPFHRTVCHCATCRRAGGAPIVAWFSVPKSSLRLVSGAMTAYRSSARVTRRFCPRCGTQITYETDDLPDEIDVTTCSLDDPDLLPPQDHTWASRRLRWVRLCDGLPDYAESRDAAAQPLPPR